jgi:hypothetical protein
MVPSAKHPVAVSVTQQVYVPTATLLRVITFLLGLMLSPNVPEVNV